MNINKVNHLAHAYKIAPWRIQRQWIGASMLAVVVLAMVASIYLDVTSNAAVAGRQIQELNLQIFARQQEIADLQTRLASLTAASVMETRALELGFRPVEPSEAEFLVVPDYIPPQPDILSQTPLLQFSPLTIQPEYSESLLEWFDKRLIGSFQGTQ